MMKLLIFAAVALSAVSSQDVVPCRHQFFQMFAVIPQNGTHCCAPAQSQQAVMIRPQIYQDIVSVPTFQKYIQTETVPVLEEIVYETEPCGCGSCGSCCVEGPSLCCGRCPDPRPLCGGYRVVEARPPCGCGCYPRYL